MNKMKKNDEYNNQNKNKNNHQLCFKGILNHKFPLCNKSFHYATGF